MEQRSAKAFALMDPSVLAAEASQSDVDSALLVAYIAAGAAIVATIVNAIVAWQSSSRDRKSKTTEARRELAVRQLNDLYTPLYLHRQMSQLLRERVGPIDGVWRLVDHIEEIVNDPVKAELVEEILAINDDISELLLTRGGLAAVRPPPASFGEFLGHARLLKMSWEEQRNQPEDDRFPFPDIDADIEAGLSQLRGLAGLP